MVRNLHLQVTGYNHREKPRLNLRNIGLTAAVSTILVSSGLVCKNLLYKPDHVVSVEDVKGKTQETLISEAEDCLMRAYNTSKEACSVLDPEWQEVSTNLTDALNYLTVANENDPTSKEILDITNNIKIDAVLQEVPERADIQTPYGPLRILKRTKKVQEPYGAPVCRVIGELNGNVFVIDTVNSDWTLEQLVNLTNQQ